MNFISSFSEEIHTRPRSTQGGRWKYHTNRTKRITPLFTKVTFYCLTFFLKEEVASWDMNLGTSTRGYTCWRNHPDSLLVIRHCKVGDFLFSSGLHFNCRVGGRLFGPTVAFLACFVAIGTLAWYECTRQNGVFQIQQNCLWNLGLMNSVIQN